MPRRDGEPGVWSAGGGELPGHRRRKQPGPSQGGELLLTWLLPVSSGVHLKPTTGSVLEKVPAKGP